MRILSELVHSSELLCFTACAFGSSVDSLCRKYFKNAREPFLITLAGEKLAILTSPRDVAAAYKNTESLSYDIFVKNLFLTFGISSKAVHKMYQPPSELVQNSDEKKQMTMFQSENPLRKGLCHLQSDFYKQQLHPGEKLDFLGVKFMHYINCHLQWESLRGSYVLSPSATSTMKTVSLYRWSREVLVNSASKTFFGKKILEIDPMFSDNFYDYDDQSWKLLYKYPRIFAKDVLSAKEKIVRTLMAYLQLPKEDRLDASWIIQTLEVEQSQIGIGNRDIAGMMMLAYWV